MLGWFCFGRGWAARCCSCCRPAPATLFSKTRTEPLSNGYAIEINIVLGAINALFISFIWVQAGYFFGGHERVLEEAGLTYAEYARRGFFEISAVAFLAFVLVLVCDGLIPATASRGRRAFNGLTVLHIGLVGVMIASAYDRLGVYIDAYGLTELRFYVATCIVWIALAFVLLGLAILSGRRVFLPRFIVSTLFVAVFVLHAINPAAIVVRTNLARENAGDDFDIDYAISMSGDAVPALVDGLSNLTGAQRVEIVTALEQRWATDDQQTYRDWNFSRWLAARVVTLNRERVSAD